jgi:hypothetical protein
MQHSTCFPDSPTEIPSPSITASEELIIGNWPLEQCRPRHVVHQILAALRRGGGSGGEPGDDGFGAGMSIEPEDGKEVYMPIPDTAWHTRLEEEN